MQFPSLFFIAPIIIALFGFQLNGQTSPPPSPARALQLCKIHQVTSDLDPTMDESRYGLDRLNDGRLPKDGWRSTWTAWYQKNPSITFDLGDARRIGAIRIYFQAWAREDELKSVEVAVSMDGNHFHPFNEYGDIATLREKGTWVEMDLRAVAGRYFRLRPQFQGWGHQWGEVEFWELTR
jgi:hypothetical protein